LNARDYYLDLQAAIHRCPHVLRSDTRFDEIHASECYIRGVLGLVHGFQLHIPEYVVTQSELQRPKYRYHLHSADGELVTRWDNAPHHPELQGFPDHRHDAAGVHPAPQMSIPRVLETLIEHL